MLMFFISGFKRLGYIFLMGFVWWKSWGFLNFSLKLLNVSIRKFEL